LELVYLWVENYKNIHEQGFNFSSRFNCDYNEKTNELTIEENDDYIPNFFGKNINVTAIVGKNGSGKSSLLEYLESILSYNYGKKYKFILLFEFNGVIYRFPDENIKCNYNLDLKEVEDIKCLSYSNSIQNSKLSLDNQNIAQIIFEINNIKKEKNSFKLSTFMYLPIDIFYGKIDILEDFKKNIEWLLLGYTTIDSDNEEKKIVQEIENIENEYHAFLIMKYLQESKNEKRDIEFSYLLNKEKLSKEFLSKDDFEKFITTIEPCKFNSLSSKERDILMEYKYFFTFDFVDEKERRFTDLSHGEKVIFGQLLNIYYFLIQKEYTIFLFDEPELSLHPDWQKKYMNEVLTLLQKMNRNNHFIFTSHSPLLLSDIPKQNIIFLDKDEKGNCKIVDGLKEKKQTFGANIHTLLSDSFFMEDGLMGEFAKGKIMQIQKFHKKVLKYKENEKVKKAYICFYSKKQKEFEQIQSIIGEPFLQKIVKNQLEEIELILLGRDEAIDKEIARLQALKASSKNA